MFRSLTENENASAHLSIRFHELKNDKDMITSAGTI